MTDSLYRERSIRMTYRSSAPLPQVPTAGPSMEQQQGQLRAHTGDDQYGDGLPSDAAMLAGAYQVVTKAMESEKRMREDV